jgi:hypothetical protein
MPSKYLNPAERKHWSDMRAAFVRSFNWPAKRKANLDYLLELSADFADKAMPAYRERIEKQP